MMAAGIALIVAGAAIGGFGLGRSSRTTASPPFRVLSLTAPGFNAAVAISPNGEWLAATSNGTLRVRRMREATWRDIPGVSDIQTGYGVIVWSPDSRLIGFATETALKKVDLVGSRPQTICENCVKPDLVRGIAWNADSVMLVGSGITDADEGLKSVSAIDGRQTRATTLNAARGENSHRFPAFLSDGRRFLFAVRRNNGEHEIQLGSLDGTPPKTVLSGFSQMAYASGHVLFIRNFTLLAQRLDLATGAVTGDPVTLLDRVAYSPTLGAGRFTVADDGTLITAAAPDAVGLKWFDRRGTALAQLTDVASSVGARVSVDGTKVVVALMDYEKASSDVAVVDVTSGARTRLTSHARWEESPVWSPDGRQVAYHTNYDSPGVYVQDAKGGPERLIAADDPASSLYPVPLDWSPDGKYVLASLFKPATQSDLILISTSEPKKVEPWLATAASEESGRFSPNGQFVAYVSTESGNAQVHIRSFSDPANAVRVTTAGGGSPAWNRNGRELLYLDENMWIVAAPVTTGSSITLGKPEKLFPTYRRDFTGSAFDIDPDGRFLIYDVENSRNTSTMTVFHLLLNWPTLTGK
jgi:Tol biopolymer transport system component